MPERAWVKTPVVVPPSAVQLVTGDGEVPQQVPRAEMEAGTPREVTFAPKVAPEEVMADEVGEVTVGTALAVQIPPTIEDPPGQMVQVGGLVAPLAQAEAVNVAVTVQLAVIAPVV